MYDLVVKDGLMIDPSQGIHEFMDAAISEGKVVEVRRGINATMARHTVDASGKIVTPGLVDIHVHCCHRIDPISIDPEMACLSRGCTTVLDAGTVGEILFTGFREYVVNRSRTRIFALLNIESLGMLDSKPTQKWEWLVMGREEMFISVDNTLETIKQNRDVILGIKHAHHGLRALQFARKAADISGVLLMVENHHQPETLRYMKRGDIVTHTFHGLKHPRTEFPRLRYWGVHDGLLDEDGRVQPEFFKAIRRGVVLDVGHGSASFVWKVAEEAFKEGIRPDTISTDLHEKSLKVVCDMPTTMAKFLSLGMSLDEVIGASTTKPADALGKQGEIGTLKPGACADITIFKLEEGKFPLIDCNGETRTGTQRLAPLQVIRGGVLYS